MKPSIKDDPVHTRAIFTCPLCDGRANVTQAQMDALNVGGAIWQMPVYEATEAMGTIISEVVGRSVAELLSDYHVQLVRKIGDDE